MMATFAILIIALSAAGFGYAHWSDRVTIEGTIKMGELIVGIKNDTLSWVETTNGFPEDEAGHSYDPKPWVANATITLSDNETSTHHVPEETVSKNMTILIENAYPQWDLHINFSFKNAGTIPAILNSTWSAYDETDSQVLTIRWDKWEWLPAEKYWNVTGAVVDPIVGDIINIFMEIELPEDYQLDPCTEYPVYVELDFKQKAEECHTYTFEWVIDAIQWNKA